MKTHHTRDLMPVQRRFARAPILASLLTGLISLFGQVEPATAQQAAGPEITGKNVVAQVGLDQRLNEQLPLDLEFKDEEGNTVRLGKYFRGKPVIVNLVYFRCPQLCTQVLNGVLEASQGIPLVLGEDYHIVSISIDPTDTPKMAAAKKKRYIANYHRPGADAGWHFLTGKQSSIDKIARAIGYRYVYDSRTDQFAHASGIVIATPEGRLSRYMYGIDYVPTDLRLNLVESSHNRIGSAVDQFLLLCYHYDPLTGKYGLAIENGIRAASLITVLVMGVFLWKMFRQERASMPIPAAAGVHPGDSSAVHLGGER